ncbi:hypothetical protein AVEN_74329-1 [Araneus ventricosus]|uniref:Uncharacterized protein n=1 Tax=Araneus ventricosus TaxID=182803 RepID=A0A4Y2HN34_ARAVE|nr:hypothetical protein AVEN_74329-1 [Araneus ventricosus]
MLKFQRGWLSIGKDGHKNEMHFFKARDKHCGVPGAHSSHDLTTQRTRRKREKKGCRDVVKTTLYYITRRGLKGPCRVTVGRSPRLTVKENSLHCGSFQ